MSGFFAFVLFTNTQIITDSVNQCMMCFVKSFDIIFLGVFEILKLA